MEKNTVIAIALSFVVMFGWIFVQRTFFTPKEQPGAVRTAADSGTAVPPAGSSGGPETSFGGASPGAGSVTAIPDAATGEVPEAERRVVIETRRATVVLSSAGGDMVSFRLREHQEGDQNVEMVYAGNGREAHAFTIAFGDRGAAPAGDLFFVNRVGEYAVEFYRDFMIPLSSSAADLDVAAGGGNRFRLIKRYTFHPDEYMFELTVTIMTVDGGGYSVPSLNAGGLAYTLGFGPQIGPRFEKLDGRSEYRRYMTYAGGKRREVKIREGVPQTTNAHLSWAAVAGKYFTLIAVPDATPYIYSYLQQAEENVVTASRFFMSRPALNASKTVDVYRFYLGPKNQGSLAIYDTGVNGFNLRDMDLSKAASSSGILAPVETALKWFLELSYRLVRNWGLAIILTTLMVKLILFPLTYKSSEGTMRMQTLSPKIKEIQEKYKTNQAQLNTKMMELYKQEGYNPMAGCAPMLVQFPILIAMYNLFNTHFDLRKAMFIPGWIPDLSVPESVFSFAPFQIPLLGWSDIRLLPFIYVGSQLLSSKITQTPDQQTNSQMKMMMYMMPVMFFFLLYNMPSGLTVYWIMTNLFSMVQQLLINQYLRKKRSAQAEAVPSRPSIAPRGGPRKRKKR